MKAILLCAGKGTRLQPMTFLKPKPMLAIGGKPLIEGVINMLNQSGVDDITVILGYKADMIIPILRQLDVEWRISSDYQTRNNHSSLLLALDKLDDCLIIDGDLYLQKDVTRFITSGRSQFIAQRNQSGLEWELLTDENDRIIRVNKDSPDGYCMSGVSYWLGDAATALREELKNCRRDEFWEDAAIRAMQHYPVYLSKAPQFAVEIDSLYDAIEKKLITADALAEQCSLVQPEKLKGLTNSTYRVNYGHGDKVLRIPGLGTSRFINRDKEVLLVRLLSGKGITPETQFYAGGVKTCKYLEDYRLLSEIPLNNAVLQALAAQIRQMHSIRLVDNQDIPPISLYHEIDVYERKAGIAFVTEQERLILREIAKEMDNDDLVLCHRDLLLENILILNEDIKIIDFEYAEFSSAYWDVGCFITEAKLSGEKRLRFIEAYGGLDELRVLKAEILVDYIWGLWGWLNNCIDYGRGRIVTFHNNFMNLLKKDLSILPK